MRNPKLEHLGRIGGRQDYVAVPEAQLLLSAVIADWVAERQRAGDNRAVMDAVYHGEVSLSTWRRLGVPWVDGPGFTGYEARTFNGVAKALGLTAQALCAMTGVEPRDLPD